MATADHTKSTPPMTRSLEQNSRLWATLTDIANQVQWPVDGKMQWLTPEDWKDILTAGVRKTQRIAAGIEGGFVMLGQRTSRMKVAEMSELIELAIFFGDSRQVKWSATDVEQKQAKAHASRVSPY